MIVCICDFNYSTCVLFIIYSELRCHLQILISPNPSLATKSALLPWSGQIYVQCDGQQKVWKTLTWGWKVVCQIMNVALCYENFTSAECVQCDFRFSLLRSRFVGTWLWMCPQLQQTRLWQPCLLRLPPQCCLWPGSPPCPRYPRRPHRHHEPWWRLATRPSSSPPLPQGKHQVGRWLTIGQKLLCSPKFRLFITAVQP